MFKQIFCSLIFACAVLSLACGDPRTGNSDNTGVNTTVLDPANMPPGLSGSPLPVNGSPIAGIPINGQPLPKGTTPTPGIPSAEELKRGPKKGTTPTPGIPDPESIRKSMGRPPSNVNANRTAANVPMMRSTNRPPQ